MELTRNQWFMVGLVVLFVGIQFRAVESYVLNESTTQFIAERMRKSGMAGGAVSLLPAVGPAARRVIRPPEWLGWAVMSIGSVLILHSLALRRE